MWKNNKDLPSPSDHGWMLVDNIYDINWFDGDQYPPDVEINGIEDDENDNEVEDDLEHYESEDDDSAGDEDGNDMEDVFQIFY